MGGDIFFTADILLPAGVSPGVWSVIACDQFSSERDYWERVKKRVDGAPSTLNMILPEAFLDDKGEEEEIAGIRSAMDDYLERGLFYKIKDSFVYIERTLPDGRVRRGVLGAVDLDAYDYTGGEAAVRASEGTVLKRLPVRIQVRRSVKLELPHIMAFIDDRDKTVIEPLSKKAGMQPPLYDFDLMEGGGHVRGVQVTGDDAAGVVAALRALQKRNRTLIVMGDGNHSLAAAKIYWEELKRGLGEAERESHPARRALIEINNVYDPAVTFEAIHRIVFDADPAGLAAALENAMINGTDYMLHWVARGRSGSIGVSAACIGDMLAALQTFLDDYASANGCSVDFIHGEEPLRQLAGVERRIGIIVPVMDKSELFETVAAGGLFPKKSFSVGCARDKRYYLESREIV